MQRCVAWLGAALSTAILLGLPTAAHAQEATPQPEPSATPSHSATSEPSPAPTPSDPSATPTPTPSPTPSPTQSPTQSPTPTPSPSPTAPPASAPRVQDVHLLLDGGSRSYRLFIPSGLAGQSAPLVIAFHGRTFSARWTEQVTGFDADAERDRFVIAYAQGYYASFNAGSCCADAVSDGIDDIAYIDALIADVSSRVVIDQRRIMTVGFSNGGMMAYRYACARATRVAAVAVVAATLVTPCRLARPVPLLAVHGLADALVPFGGSRFHPILGTPLAPVLDTLGVFARAAGCGAPAVQRVQRTTWRRWSRCAPGVSVELATVTGMDHCWCATASDGLDLSAEVWRFVRVYGTRSFGPDLPTSVVARAPTSVPYTAQLNVTGRLVGRYDVVGSQPVMLEYSLNEAPGWRPGPTVFTTPNGAFAVAMRVSRNHMVRVRYLGSAVNAVSASGALGIRVPYLLSTIRPAALARVGQALVLRGTVRPLAARVWLQRRDPVSGRWTSVTSVLTAPDGRFSVSLTEAAGTATYRFAVPTDVRNSQAATSSMTVRWVR